MWCPTPRQPECDATSDSANRQCALSLNLADTCDSATNYPAHPSVLLSKDNTLA
jgi:hypothetical protein